MTKSGMPSLEIKSDRLPPKNEEAEQALLGALLYNNGAYEQISEFLLPEHFSNGTHERIYEAISFLIEKGQIADPITLHQYFSQEKSLEEVGGAAYLTQLAESVVSIINTADYGHTIYDLYLRRQLINLGAEVVNGAHQFELDKKALDQVEETEKKLFELASTGSTERSALPFSKALSEAIYSAESAFQRDSHVVGVTSGLIDLDKRLGGFHPSDLLILAGRPSMGKTGLATGLAFNAAKATLTDKQHDGAGVLFFSLEMSSEQLATRLLAQEVKISSDRIRRGDLSQDDFPKFVEASRKLANLPLFIDDTPALSVSALRTRARRLKRQHDIGMIVVDYLQLLQPAGGKSRADNRVQEISEISRSLKALAKELHVPVIALSQLSRAVEQRDDKRPQLADLRESGSIEQDADVVMFIYREEYYESRKEPQEGTEKHREWQERMAQIYKQADVIIAKQRHGPIGTVKLYFEGPLIQFSNLTDAEVN
ncbi:MAG: replicative DNA helicase [bacterium]|nr:replicative DNA helicase [bacterium]